MPETIGTIGFELNLLIKQGSTFGPHQVTVRNPDNTPVDLTGATIRAQMRRKALDTALVAQFDITYVNRPSGIVTFGLTDEVTMAIVTAEILRDKNSKFVWDMELEDSIGRVIPLMYGEVSVFREVTRA